MSIWTVIGIAIAFGAGLFLGGLMASQHVSKAEEWAEFWQDKYSALVETVSTRTDQAGAGKCTKEEA